MFAQVDSLRAQFVDSHMQVLVLQPPWATTQHTTLHQRTLSRQAAPQGARHIGRTIAEGSYVAKKRGAPFSLLSPGHRAHKRLESIERCRKTGSNRLQM